MWAIIKKEVKTYFYSPIGYIFIGLFLAMCSVFFYLDVYYYGTTNFENMFYSAATILTFIIPILTMRMFSEERKNGTEQLLITSPRSLTSIVLGKFIAASIIVIISELFTFMYFGILTYFGAPHLSTALVTLFGYLLLGMAYISFGMFASSLTENQIISGVLSIGVFILLWFLPNFNENFSQFSLINIFSRSFPTGVIDPEAVVLLVSFSLVFVLFTILVLQRKKSIK